MWAISMPTQIAVDLRLDDRSLKRRQNALPLFKTKPDLGKLINAFLEAVNDLITDQLPLIVNLPKMNRKMHEQYLPERLGPDSAKLSYSETKMATSKPREKTTPHKMACSRH